jgi:alanine racemase
MNIMEQFVDPQISHLSQRPTRVEVALGAARHNLAQVRQLTAAKVMPVVKANAYGHGILEMSRFYEAEGVDALAVGFLEEGILLRTNGIELPILVLGGMLSDQAGEFIQYNLIPTVSSMTKAEQMAAAARAQGVLTGVHLKIDTGMERIGVHRENALPFVEQAMELTGIRVDGIYSHFATADLPDDTFAPEQLQAFLDLLDEIEKSGIKIPLRHLANSAGLIRFPEAHLDMVRPGLMLYGCYPAAWLAEQVDLQPVLSLKSQVAYFKVVAAERGISYGHRHVTGFQTRVVTVPVGYGDGYDRGLSNRGEVLIGGKKLPVTGTICMDQFMVDIGPAGSAWNGDEVVLIGNQGEECITVEEIAHTLGTVPWEVLTRLNTRIPRVYGEK